MEQIYLSNSSIKASFKLKGAELSSLLLNDKEYIWQADPSIWNRHAPVLFPIVGKLVDDTYYVEGKPYHLPQHGFARDSTFTLVENKDNTVKFLLGSDEQTLKIYPFSFNLYISYTLLEQSLYVKFEVENPSKETILFSIGGHPAFNCPLEPNSEAFDDYVIDFHDGSKEKQTYPLNGPYLAKGRHTLPLDDGKLPLHYALFKNDAVIIDSEIPAKVSVRSKKTGAGFFMEYGEFRWLGIWTKTEGAGFLCLEPWNGIADADDYDQDFNKKPGINHLAAGETYTASYEMGFYQ